jgi:glycosyltransferase involved in cell wall biosynthesis
LPKLTFVTPFGDRLGGSENFLLTFLRHCDRERIDPLVVTLGRGSFGRDLEGIGVRSIALDAGSLRDARRTFATIARLRGVLRDEQPDLVVGWVAQSHLFAAPAAVLAGLSDRLVLWQHGLPAVGSRVFSRDDSLPSGPRLDRLVTLLPSKAVGTVSHPAAEAQRRLWPHRRTFAVLPGIDEPDRAPPEAIAELRSALAIPPERSVVGTVGRLQPLKGQHRVIEAVAALRARGHDVHGLVVGGDAHGLAPEYGPYLRRLAGERGLQRAVAFTGQVADAAPYFQLMDVSVNATAPEPFGLALLESMALGVPVVAVDSGGPSEIVEQGRSGLLAPSNRPDHLAAAIARLLDDPALRRRIAERAADRFRSHFTAERMVEEMQQRLLELAAG